MKAKTTSPMIAAPPGSVVCVCAPCVCGAGGRSQNRFQDRSKRRSRDRARGRLVARAKAASLSANTRRTYATGWRSFCSWADDQGVDVWSAAPADVVGWLVDLAADGKRPSTLRTYRAGAAHRYGRRPGPNPARDPEVSCVVSGLGRLAAEEGYAPKQADPLRWQHVELISDTAFDPRRNQPGGRKETPEQAAHRALVDIAMVVVAHDGLLRSCELLALKWDDVITPENGECAQLRIRRSKTDQTAVGAVAPISQYAFEALNRIKPPDADPQHRVFDFSASTLYRRLKAAARHAGIDASNISTHSPRVGMAQDLAASGASMRCF